MRRFIKGFLDDRAGATTIEYCVIICLLGIVVASSIMALGAVYNIKFANISEAIK